MVPFADMRMLRLDWLHCADLGVSADFLGSLIWYFVAKRKVPAGTTQKRRMRAMHLLMQDFYRRRPADQKKNQLPNLTIGVVKGKKKKFPKLRAGGGQVRHLIPWGVELVERFCDRNDPAESSMYFGMQSLSRCYAALSGLFPHVNDVLQDDSKRFALHFAALAQTTAIFRVKPKLHAFLELCSSGGQPSKHWNYRDEDFGGSVANFGKRRGGPPSTAEFSRSSMTKFHGQPVVRLVAA